MGQNTTQMRPFPWPLVFIGIGVLLIVLVLGIGVASNSPRATPTPTAAVLPQVVRISIEKAYQAFANDEAVFLDVRNLNDYETGHIPGAIHIPYVQLEDNLSSLAKDAWIITYCT